jgi:hypothetical protein
MNNNINKLDLLFLSNKELYNKFLENNQNNYIDIKNDVIKYKKEIKIRINKILDNYLDNNIDINKILKSKNDSEKYKHNFYIFLLNLIENIKLQELRKSINKDLSGVKNISNLNTYDLCSNILELDIKLAENNNKVNKIINLDDFVNKKNQVCKKKILPKKR